jgi:hypothetical protein
MSLSEGLSFLLKDAMAMYRLISGLCEEDDQMRSSDLHDAMGEKKNVFDGLAVNASGNHIKSRPLLSLLLSGEPSRGFMTRAIAILYAQGTSRWRHGSSS